jgi:hypothetical protein
LIGDPGNDADFGGVEEGEFEVLIVMLEHSAGNPVGTISEIYEVVSVDWQLLDSLHELIIDCVGNQSLLSIDSTEDYLINIL